MNFFAHPHIFRMRHRFGQGSTHGKTMPSRFDTLANAPVGSRVKVIGFKSALVDERRAQLQSYGLAPGQTVQVIQHVPVTVLLIEQFELALEREMAAYVEVTQDLFE